MTTKESGAFRDDIRMDQYRVAAYLDILNGISADARIACGQIVTVTRAGLVPGDRSGTTASSGGAGRGESDPGANRPDGRGPDDDGPCDGGPGGAAGPSDQPNDALRHLVQVRDGDCTFPPCPRHACDSDFEHALPYDKGGRTCACNPGARSRACHQVKQSPG